MLSSVPVDPKVLKQQIIRKIAFLPAKPSNMRISLLTLLAFAIVSSSCHFIEGRHVDGNGKVVTREHPVGSFDRVEVSGALDVYLKQDSGNAPVRVETDENLQDLIQISESNGTLYISPVERYNLQATRLKIYVSTSRIRGLHVSGASHIFGENRFNSSETFDLEISGASEVKVDVKAPRVNAEVDGASTAELAGETRDFSANGSGASNFKCFGLMAENTKVDISGACSADVFASVKLDVEASGASEVQYRGAAAVTQDVNGASSIRKAD